MQILTIDPSTSNLGWCCGRQSGSIAIKGKDRPSKLDVVESSLKDLIKKFKPLAVVYYRPFCRGEAATRSLLGVAALIEYLAKRHGAAVLDFTDGQVRKHFAINSNLKGTKKRADLKRQAIAAATLLTKQEMKDDDEAEAVLLYHYSINKVKVDAK